MRLENVTPELAVQVLNAAALAVFAWLLAKGILVPMPVVEKYMLSPLNDRIAALEKLSSKRDEQNAELQRMQAEAIGAQGKAIQLLHEQLQAQGRGGD